MPVIFGVTEFHCNNFAEKLSAVRLAPARPHRLSVFTFVPHSTFAPCSIHSCIFFMLDLDRMSRTCFSRFSTEILSLLKLYRDPTISYVYIFFYFIEKFLLDERREIFALRVTVCVKQRSSWVRLTSFTFISIYLFFFQKYEFIIDHMHWINTNCRYLLILIIYNSIILIFSWLLFIIRIY